VAIFNDLSAQLPEHVFRLRFPRIYSVLDATVDAPLGLAFLDLRETGADYSVLKPMDYAYEMV
jgi:hypothetical protein